DALTLASMNSLRAPALREPHDRQDGRPPRGPASRRRARRRISPGPTRPYIFGRRRAANAAFGQISARGMLNEVYNRRILELAASIPRLGRLADPDATARAHSKLCGSTVIPDLQMEGDPLTPLAPHPKAF